MLQRAPAHRAKSWAWPGSDRAESASDADFNALAMSVGEQEDPLGVRIYWRRNIRYLVKLFGR